MSSAKGLSRVRRRAAGEVTLAPAIWRGDREGKRRSGSSRSRANPVKLVVREVLGGRLPASLDVWVVKNVGFGLGIASSELKIGKQSKKALRDAIKMVFPRAKATVVVADWDRLV